MEDTNSARKPCPSKEKMFRLHLQRERLEQQRHWLKKQMQILEDQRHRITKIKEHLGAAKA